MLKDETVVQDCININFSVLEERLLSVSTKDDFLKIYSDLNNLTNYWFLEVKRFEEESIKLFETKNLKEKEAMFEKISLTLSMMTFLEQYLFIWSNIYSEQRVRIFTLINGVQKVSELLFKNKKIAKLVDEYSKNFSDDDIRNRSLQNILRNFNSKDESLFVLEKMALNNAEFLSSEKHMFEYVKTFWLSLSPFMLKKCSDTIKERINFNKDKYRTKENILVFTTEDWVEIQADPYLCKHKKVKDWRNKIESSEEFKKLLDLLEKQILMNNSVLKNFNNDDSAYFDIKLKENDLIDTKEKMIEFYSSLQNNVFKEMKEKVGTLNYYKVKQYFEEQDSTLLERRKKLFSNKSNSVFPIEQTIFKTLNVLSKEFGFTFQKKIEYKTNELIVIQYKINYKNKEEYVFFNMTPDGEINYCSNLNKVYPFFENKNQISIYQVNILVNEESLENGEFSVSEVTNLFHEIGHLMNTITSQGLCFSLKKMDTIELPSILMENYLLQERFIQQIANVKLSKEDLELIKIITDTGNYEFMWRDCTKVFAKAMIKAMVVKKGDLQIVIDKIDKHFKSKGIEWEKNLLINGFDWHNTGVKLSFFDYEVNNFNYAIGRLVAKNMLKEKINLKNTFTNIFNYDMIKIDHTCWSKYVEF